MEESPELRLLFHRLNNQLGIILAHAELLEAKSADEVNRARAAQVVTSALEAMATAREIRQQHIADEEIAAPMHHCGRNVPREVSELDEVGFTSTPSAMVKPPRIREAPVAFECRLSETIETSSRYIFIGQVVWLSARSGLVDTERWRVNLRHYRPVARFGASYYIRTSDRFEIEDSQASNHHNQESFDRL